MFAYKITRFDLDLPLNIAYIWIDDEPVIYETKEDKLALLREDYRFVIYLDKMYRVCQVEFDEDRRFIKFWPKDPFEGFEDYEQIDIAPTTRLSGEVASKIFDILKEAGVAEGDRADFIITQMRGCVEYRFGGKLGYGGKFWNYHDSWYVNYYQEDKTRDRDSIVKTVNKKLVKLKEDNG